MLLLDVQTDALHQPTPILHIPLAEVEVAAAMLLLLQLSVLSHAPVPWKFLSRGKGSSGDTWWLPSNADVQTQHLSRGLLLPWFEFTTVDNTSSPNHTDPRT